MKRMRDVSATHAARCEAFRERQSASRVECGSSFGLKELHRLLGHVYGPCEAQAVTHHIEGVTPAFMRVGSARLNQPIYAPGVPKESALYPDRSERARTERVGRLNALQFRKRKTARD